MPGKQKMPLLGGISLNLSQKRGLFYFRELLNEVDQLV